MTLQQLLVSSRLTNFNESPSRTEIISMGRYIIDKICRAFSVELLSDQDNLQERIEALEQTLTTANISLNDKEAPPENFLHLFHLSQLDLRYF